MFETEKRDSLLSIMKEICKVRQDDVIRAYEEMERGLSTIEDVQDAVEAFAEAVELMNYTRYQTVKA